MRSLLDINVIIALFDPDHAFHDRAHDWWAENAASGWASCPLIENGVVRIMTHSNYSQKTRLVPGDLIAQLRQFAAQTDHEFWPDDLSLRDPAAFAADRIHGPQKITDVYLLALAAHHGGRLTTFDQGIPVSAARRAKTANLSVI